MAAPHLSSPAPLSVVVLAAGEGSRMPFPGPKVVLPVGEQPMLAHVLNTVVSLSPDSVHVVVGRHRPAIEVALSEAGVPWSTHWHWVDQAQPRGTGDAVRCALQGVPDGHRVLVVLGDVPLLRAASVQAMLDVAETTGVAMLNVCMTDPAGMGRVVRDTTGSFEAVVEERDATDEQRRLNECWTGCLVAPAVFLRRACSQLTTDNAQSECYLPPVLSMWCAEGHRVGTVQTEAADEALGANTPQQWQTLERAYQRRCVAALAEAGVRVVDWERLEVRGDVQAGEGTVLDVGVVLQGRVRLGQHCHVGAYSVLTDVELADGAVVRPHSVLTGSSVAQHAAVGPFAYLRPGCKVGEAARVGCFVEMKNTRLGAGSKASHLSYLGDADVGKAVNVGAGTITCNYDGHTKWPTTVGDGAFVGAGVQFIAPVTIGAGATIGAGSCITRDVAPQALALSRAKQVEHTGWQRRSQRRTEPASADTTLPPQPTSEA